MHARRHRLTPVSVAGLLTALLINAPTLAFAGSARQSAPPPAWMNAALTAAQRSNLLLGQMSTSQKVNLVTGNLNYNYGFYNSPLTALRVPALTMTDGPAGVRVNNQKVNGGKATALPSPIGLAATFDPSLAQPYGNVIGTEAFDTGHNVSLAPNVDIARVPLWGRVSEAFGEDPLLQQAMAVPDIQGIQSHPVVSTVKHYAVYNQEINRFTVDARVSERVLHEIYLPPFQSAVQQGHPGAVMCSFNKVNGQSACQNKSLLTNVLKGQFGFQGWVMSDYGANPTTTTSANAGLDQELPNAGNWGSKLTAAVNAGQVSMG